MKKLTLAVVAALGIFATSMAMPQKGMKMDHKMMPMKMASSDATMKTMMMGLTPAEKKIAADHMKHMSMAEKAVMMKRAKLCMADPHKGMSMEMKPTEAQMMEHMMTGLSMSEQKTMKTMMGKMNAKQMAVAKKMMTNCCMVGMKHGM